MMFQAAIIPHKGRLKNKTSGRLVPVGGCGLRADSIRLLYGVVRTLRRRAPVYLLAAAFQRRPCLADAVADTAYRTADDARTVRFYSVPCAVAAGQRQHCGGNQ